MNDLMRPSRYQAYRHIDNTNPHAGESIVADIVGLICESGDSLAQNCRIAVRAGDLLAVRNAGAYAASMASNYNSRPHAAEVLVSGSEIRLIRRREQAADLPAGELACLQDIFRLLSGNRISQSSHPARPI